MSTLTKFKVGDRVRFDKSQAYPYDGENGVGIITEVMGDLIETLYVVDWGQLGPKEVLYLPIYLIKVIDPNDLLKEIL